MEFDLDQFMQQDMTSALSDRELLPPGEYVAQIGKPKGKRWVSKDQSQTGVSVVFALSVQTEDGSTVSVPTSFIVTLNDDGKIDDAPGKNFRLKEYRDATGNNEEGKPFNLGMLEGQTVRVVISHDLYEGKVSERVKSVRAL